MGHSDSDREGREKERGTKRDRYRETDRQTDRGTERRRQRENERDRDRGTKRQAGLKDTESKTEKQVRLKDRYNRQTNSHIETYRKTARQPEQLERARKKPNTP